MIENANDKKFMARALELAEQGRGFVEPNPMVGCVIVRDGRIVGEGWHQRFGGPHAEIEALSNADAAAQEAVAFVTLEPCCHQAKTGPCTQALIDAEIAGVVIGCQDPNPAVAGKGIAKLRAAGIEVRESTLVEDAQALIAPFSKLMTKRRPWVIAKWAMTLDGKLATSSGSSKWISSEASRILVHRLRGQVDAVLIGRGTAALDDPLLTARPAGPRTPLRIVLDSSASLSADSQLVKSIDEAPLLVVVDADAPQEQCSHLMGLGVEVFTATGNEKSERLASLLDELGRREVTNLLVEGGATVLGSLFEANAIDEVHAFVAPKLIGGDAAPSAIAGQGISDMANAIDLERIFTKTLGGDVYISGRVRRD